MKINCYKTNKEQLYKTFCVLAEKCYENRSQTNVLTTADMTKDLDEYLWSYSKKKFIPHALVSDPYSAIQPILISCHTNKVRHADMYLFLKLDNNLIIEILEQIENLKEVKKIIILDSDDNNRDLLIKDIKQRNLIEISEAKFYSQSAKNTWIEN